MKKNLWLLAALFTAGLMTASVSAESDPAGVVDGVVMYHNDVKGFSFGCPEGVSARTSEYGSSIVKLSDTGVPFILVSYNDRSDDAEAYLNIISQNALESKTIVNEPEGPAPVEANPGMYALTYSYTEDGTEYRVTCFTEECENGFMYFEARYYPYSDSDMLSDVFNVVLATADPD